MSSFNLLKNAMFYPNPQNRREAWFDLLYNWTDKEKYYDRGVWGEYNECPFVRPFWSKLVDNKLFKYLFNTKNHFYGWILKKDL